MSNEIDFFPNAGIQFVFGDLAQVRSKLLGYELAGIHSVVNVLAGQYAENKSYKENTLETESFYEQERDEFNENSRSESTSESMRQAVQKQVSKSTDFTASLSASAQTPVARVSAGVSYNRSTAKSQSRSDARSFAKQVVESATNSVRRKISSSMSEKRITKEIEEQVRGLDNKGGDAAAMITRYIEEVWGYELLQHNKHLFARFIIPKPAANYLNALEERAAGQQAASEQFVPLKFIDPTTNAERVLTPEAISPKNWFTLAALFEISDPTLPPVRKVKTHCWADTEATDGTPGPFIETASIGVPEGYRAATMHVSHELSTHSHKLGSNSWKKSGIGIVVGGQTEIYKWWDSETVNPGPFDFTKEEIEGNLEIGLVSHSQNHGVVGINIFFEPTQEALDLWKLAFFEQLMDAHNAAQRNSPAEQFGLISVADLSGSPTAAERMIAKQIEALSLQYVCGTNLNGLGGVDRQTADFPNYPILDHARINDLQSVLSFLTGAFDFDKMSYRMLPHYLGDEEQRSMAFKGGTNGKLDEFVQAGAVDIILPIAHGAEEQLLYFMQTGLIMEGNDIPLPLDPEMLALYEEITEARQMEQLEDPIVLDSWTDNLPTTHVMLQDGASLPDFRSGGSNPGPVSGNQLTPGSGE